MKYERKRRRMKMGRKIVKINSNAKSKMIILLTIGLVFGLLLFIATDFNFTAGNNGKSSAYNDAINLNTLKTSQNGVLYSEDFNDGIADFWETIGGTWTVENNHYKATGTPGERVRSYYNNQTFHNYIYEGDFNLVSGTEMQIIFNIQNISLGVDQGYYCQLTLFYDDPGDRKNSVILYSTQNYQATHKIVSYNFSNNQWYHFKVISTGAEVEFFLNNSLVLSFSGVFYTSGFIGVKAMYGPIAYWDNITVNGINTNDDQMPIISGYNLFFLLGVLSVVAILIRKKLKKY